MANNNPRQRALLALLVLVPIPSVGTALAMHVPAAQGAVGQIAYGVCKLLLIALPLGWLLWVDKGKLSWSKPQRGGFGVAALLGLMICGIVLAAYWLIGRAWIDPEQVRQAALRNGIGTPLRYLAFSAYVFLINAALEEYVWRWFVFRKCEVLIGGLRAVGLSALLFTVHHVVALRAQFGWDVTLLASAGIFVGGAMWSWCYLKYRSIWPGYLSHLIVDVAVFIIGWQIIFASG